MDTDRGGPLVERPLAMAKRAGSTIADTIVELVSVIPDSSEAGSYSPRARASSLARQAAKKAAGIAGGAAAIPGPFGLLTLLMDIVGVWKVQAQMVADIAASYGKTASLTREQMLYCLFKHTASQGLRDIVVRAGERFLVRRTSLRVLQKAAAVIGVKVTQKATGKVIARYAPVVGAMGVAAYAHYDTKKVAETAIALFEAEVVLVEEAASVERSAY